MTSRYDTLLYEKKGARANITLNRPELLNAVAMNGVIELHSVAKLIAEDNDIRMVTINGAGRAFSTGIDLKDLSNGKIDNSYYDLWDQALRHFEVMEKLVICRIHGYALGGGLQLALAADIRVCTPCAKLGLPAIKEGLIPGLGTLRLARYIGVGRAKRLIISGEMVDGEEGEKIGLVDYLVSPNNTKKEFEVIVDKLASLNSHGCRLSKQMLAHCFDLDFDNYFTLYKSLQADATSSADFKEAMSAYKEKRTPVWS